MHSLLALFLVVLTLPALAITNQEKLQNIKSLRRIAFGSCNDQNEAQPLWKDVLDQAPDLWIWHGDAIYADWNKNGQAVLSAFGKQNTNMDYVKVKSKIPIVGTWDDHDYAFDNADGGYKNKKESQKMFLDFLEEPEDSTRRQKDGVYTSYEFGEREQKIKIILLDNRYFKDDDPEYVLLGKQQWAWLENEFKNSTANLHFIVSGLSIFSPLLPYSEEWREHPKEVNRMEALLKTYKVKAPLFISGDKHFSSIFQNSGHLEFLSSGMTHTVARRAWWLISRKFSMTYFGLAYGVIDIDWEANLPKLTMFIRNGDRSIHTSKVLWKDNAWSFISKSEEPGMQTSNEEVKSDEALKKKFAKKK